MSGPKVVRVVTPKEREIIKNRWLTQLGRTIQQFKSYAQKNGVLDQELSQGLEETLAHYQAIPAEDYQRIEREVPNQINFLKAEKAKLVKKVNKEKTNIWNEYRQLKSTEVELKKMLLERNISFESIDQPSVITKKNLAQYSRQIDAMYDKLKEALNHKSSLTAEQQEIQKRLSAGDSLLSVKEWPKELPMASSREQKLEQTLRELFLEDIAQDKIQEFIDRVEQLHQNDQGYDLQLDSIILEAATFQKEQVELRIAEQALSEALDQLKQINEKLTIISKWESLLQQEDIKQIKNATTKANQLYKNTTELIIVEARRTAIKMALTKAGYEVNDSMETAWVENGRLVVKKATNSLYGIEFMNPKNLSKIQARVVADEDRTQERSQSQDLHQEEIWCDEFSEIKEILERENLSIHIEKAMAVGAIPIKEVKLEGSFKKSSSTVKKKKTL
ncbi:V-type ATP synthase subunit I domain-containing protein [Nonlabens xiamenensis]|uniref:hypothetical protein n=1 Tax=Nonlabens xiamenensis TaxID=2341043 RepID=UPI000F60FD66|nr:hypothetical protein [Nonlabens xiamenensis]